MGKLLVGIDYSPASVTALQAVLNLRRALRQTLAVYHAYQLPTGLPFLSPHVIEKMEQEAEADASKKLKDFLRAHVPAAELRGVRLYAQRDFLSEGLKRLLTTNSYTLLALGAQSTIDEGEGALGFHSRHFIYNSPIPTLICFPDYLVRWERLLVAYDPTHSSPQGMAFLRQVAKKTGSEIVGLPILRPSSQIDRLHRKLQRTLHPKKYTRLVWEGSRLVELLLHAAHSYGADVIALHTAPSPIVEGLQVLPFNSFVGKPAWLFLPPAPSPSTPTEE